MSEHYEIEVRSRSYSGGRIPGMTENQKELVIAVLEAALEDLSRNMRQNLANDWLEDVADDERYIDAVNVHLEELKA